MFCAKHRDENTHIDVCNKACQSKGCMTVRIVVVNAKNFLGEKIQDLSLLRAVHREATVKIIF